MDGYLCVLCLCIISIDAMTEQGIQELEKILLEAKTDVSGKWISKIHLQELLNKLREKEKANDSD